jgi:inhibitor of cysteine peptidase
LDDISTTGYRWTVDSLDRSVVELTGTDLLPYAGIGIGGGGRRTFTFSAKSPGQTLVRLKLWREWEGDCSVIDDFKTELNVSL